MVLRDTVELAELTLSPAYSNGISNARSMAIYANKHKGIGAQAMCHTHTHAQFDCTY